MTNFPFNWAIGTPFFSPFVNIVTKNTYDLALQGKKTFVVVSNFWYVDTLHMSAIINQLINFQE